jgi:UV DNA damage endonuclease
MIQRTFQQKGISYASELALENVRDLVKIIEWNNVNNIKIFRLGSGIFPWASQYNLTDLPDYEEIASTLAKAGKLAGLYTQRITSHPDHFVKLASSKPTVVENSIKDLELHSTIFDLMGLAATPYNALNIHVGMNFSQEVVDRWIAGYNQLSPNCKARLVVENDDKASMYSVRDLYEMLHGDIAIPITFDYWHHTFNTGDLSEKEAFFMARETWTRHGVTQCTHYSESRRREAQRLIEGICDKHGLAQEDLPKWPTFAKMYKEFSKIKEQAHADFILRLPDTYGVDALDVEVEAKAKEQAIMNVGIDCHATPIILS